MTTKTCVSCKHWLPDDENADKEDGYGVCGRVKQRKDVLRSHTQEDEPAVTQDGSSYWSAILCRDDFGCVLWEDKANV